MGSQKPVLLTKGMEVTFSEGDGVLRDKKKNKKKSSAVWCLFMQARQRAPRVLWNILFFAA
jgi:hypothetical protein